jgi:hypothetical protein
MTAADRSAKLAFLTVCTVLILSTLAFAHGNQQHVMGTVAKIDGVSITIKTTDGEAKTVMIVADTKFVKGSSPATQKDLRVGDRVVIHAKPEGGMLHATEVKIGTEMKGTPHQH